MRGRLVAAGASIAVGSALVGFMAARDQSADATPASTSANPTSGVPSGRSDGGSSATPPSGRTDDGFGDFGGSSTGDSGFSPQPQTRTGGS